MTHLALFGGNGKNCADLAHLPARVGSMNNDTPTTSTNHSLTEVALEVARLAEELAAVSDRLRQLATEQAEFDNNREAPIEFMTVTQVAKFLGIQRASVYRYPDLPFVTVGARRRYYIEDVRAWARSRTTRHTHAKDPAQR